MKKVFISSLILVFFLLMGACNKNIENGENDAPIETDIIAVLEAEGYTLTTYDSDTRSYHGTYVKDTYDVTITVLAFYQGYINTDERFVRVVICETALEAQNYYNALVTEGEYHVYRDGAAIVASSSLETIELFTE